MKILYNFNLRHLGILVYTLCVTTPLSALNIQEITTPKGIKAWFVQDKSVPVVSMAFSFEGGTANVPKDQEGILDFIAELLQEGAGDLDAHAFKDKVESAGIEFSFSADNDYFYGSLRTNLDNRSEAFKLLKAILTAPRFDDASVHLVRERLLTGLRNAQKQPNYLIKQKMRATLYKNLPYGRPLEGTLASLNAITKADLKKMFTQELQRKNLKIAVCGNLDVKEVQKMLDEIFGDIPNGTASKEMEAPVINFPGGVLVEKGPFPQSVCFFLQQGLKTQDPNYIKLALLNEVVGAKSTSRLFQEVREKRGLAYTANTYVSHTKYTHLYAGYVGSENARIKDAIDIIKDEWKKIQQEGITAQELENAKKALHGSFAFAFANTMTTAQTLQAYQLDGFTPQYIYDREKRINSVSLSDINKFIKTFINPSQLTFFIVGEPQGLP